MKRARDRFALVDDDPDKDGGEMVLIDDDNDSDGSDDISLEELAFAAVPIPGTPVPQAPQVPATPQRPVAPPTLPPLRAPAQTAPLIDLTAADRTYREEVNPIPSAAFVVRPSMMITPDVALQTFDMGTDVVRKRSAETRMSKTRLKEFHTLREHEVFMSQYMATFALPAGNKTREQYLAMVNASLVHVMPHDELIYLLLRAPSRRTVSMLSLLLPDEERAAYVEREFAKIKNLAPLVGLYSAPLPVSLHDTDRFFIAQHCLVYIFAAGFSGYSFETLEPLTRTLPQNVFNAYLGAYIAGCYEKSPATTRKMIDGFLQNHLVDRGLDSLAVFTFYILRALARTDDSAFYKSHIESIVPGHMVVELMYKNNVRTPYELFNVGPKILTLLTRPNPTNLMPSTDFIFSDRYAHLDFRFLNEYTAKYFYSALLMRPTGISADDMAAALNKLGNSLKWHVRFSAPVETFLLRLLDLPWLPANAKISFGADVIQYLKLACADPNAIRRFVARGATVDASRSTAARIKRPEAYYSNWRGAVVIDEARMNAFLEATTAASDLLAATMVSVRVSLRFWKERLAQLTDRIPSVELKRYRLLNAMHSIMDKMPPFDTEMPEFKQILFNGLRALTDQATRYQIAKIFAIQGSPSALLYDRPKEALDFLDRFKRLCGDQASILLPFDGNAANLTPPAAKQLLKSRQDMQELVEQDYPVNYVTKLFDMVREQKNPILLHMIAFDLRVLLSCVLFVERLYKARPGLSQDLDALVAALRPAQSSDYCAVHRGLSLFLNSYAVRTTIQRCEELERLRAVPGSVELYNAELTATEKRWSRMNVFVSDAFLVFTAILNDNQALI